jgi:hypothetical protein
MRNPSYLHLRSSRDQSITRWLLVIAAILCVLTLGFAL